MGLFGARVLLVPRIRLFFTIDEAASVTNVDFKVLQMVRDREVDRVLARRVLTAVAGHVRVPSGQVHIIVVPDLAIATNRSSTRSSDGSR